MRRTQQDRSSSTKAALVAAARELFTARGYHAVPAAEIVRAAGVTRGALYHHFGDKQGLFRAVIEEIEGEVTAEIGAALDGAEDPVLAMATALNMFLDACLREDVRQLTLADAPAVLGWSAFRELEAEYGLGLLVDAFTRFADAGLLVSQPLRTLAQLVLSTVMEAAHMIAEAADPAATRGEVEQVLGVWFAALLRPPPDEV
ncbi:MAG TPA: TetR/AcrR family transcriptional regulator [Amycolatopsis sp.]|nr:TetR/AcrR family transcriptional regulator [Amycolatopsis sp.]